jgi:hypothetical protein
MTTLHAKNTPLRISLIIPAYNEAESLPRVLTSIPKCITEVVVVDNGSSDATASIAIQHGARVISEPQRGYGQACLAGLAALEQDPPDLVAFADGDGSDNHPQLVQLVQSLIKNQLDLVLARRIAHNEYALSPQQRFGNRLATTLINMIWGVKFHDLGPMRVLRWAALKQLNMNDRNFGWTIEMQIRAVQHKLRWQEVPLLYLPRYAGKSKISRTASGVVRAGSKILWIVVRELWFDRTQVVQSLAQRIWQRLRHKDTPPINSDAATGARKI